MHRRVPLAGLLPLLLLTSPASAEVRWDFSAWSAAIGLSAPDKIDNTFFLSGGGEYARLNDRAVLDGRLMYWNSSNGSGDLTLDFSDFAILTGTTYRFTPQATFTPLARGGLGIHRFKAEVDLGPFGTGSGTNTELGVYLGGGMAFRTGSTFEVLTILEYHVMEADFFVLGAEARVSLP